MVEGMISSEDKGRGESLRDVAERYLFELANRCMVQVEIDELPLYNRFKSCRLHDMIRDLCLSKGKRQGFLEVMVREMGGGDSSICKTNRFAIHAVGVDNDLSQRIGENKNIRSFVFKGYQFENWKLPKGIAKWKLLKLLSLENSIVKELPPSICKLPRLQTLNVKNTMRLPNCIYKMKRLRHLFMKDDHERVGGEKLKFEGLNKLEMVDDIWVGDVVDDITHLLKLPKMDMDVNTNREDGLTLFRRLVMCHSLHYLRITHCRVSMVMCHSLHYLRITHCRVSKLPAYEIQLYQNVIEWQLVGTRIEEDPMEILEKLPMLRVLGLWSNPYVGREMVYRATGFPQLRELVLHRLLNLMGWRVEKGAMLNLSSLLIAECSKLKMIPDELEFINTLQTREASHVKSSWLVEQSICGQRDGLSGNWISSTQGTCFT
ncbi:putative disease resistance protein At1g59780 [Sesamum indicum]|uniref:Disease resistance protein At1g59780 n=1 Tax=Sesamum indicum TaxID=4182 RepID=A0A6I9SX82_SESIN|nr:putative disease resistance protein At1g59780 [Sesamum indicum]